TAGGGAAASASTGPPAAARVGWSLRRRFGAGSSPRAAAEGDSVGMRRTPSTVVAIAGTVPVPVAATMAGSDCCMSQRMVSPSDLCPSSRVSCAILAAQLTGMRMRRPRPSTLTWRSRFRGGGFATASPRRNSTATGSGFGTRAIPAANADPSAAIPASSRLSTSSSSPSPSPFSCSRDTTGDRIGAYPANAASRGPSSSCNATGDWIGG
ncbi:Os09g0521350, partial [Oryza sativa Japonica Group]